jgi:predicted HAD superfamily Cof-like phosphohydrolase
MSDGYHDVLAFHYKYDVRTSLVDKPHIPARDVLDFRRKFLQEELDEFQLAYTSVDIEKSLDALIDLVYVAYGTAILMGISPRCWQECWDEVQRANMTKMRAPTAGDSKRGHELDVVKPEGWRPPTFSEILRKHGE